MQDRIIEFIRANPAAPPSEDDFTALALDVFARQYETVPLYRRLCEARGVRPGQASDWHAVPAAPADIFKADLGDGLTDPHIFLSSGTTQGPQRRSRHAIASLDTYRASALEQFERMVLPDSPGRMSVLVLGPTRTSHPHSSLAQMFEWCLSEYGNDLGATTFDDNGGFDLAGAVDWLRSAASATQPALILSVSSALSPVIDELRKRSLELRLPADSRIVDTGGNKPSAAGSRVMSAKGLLKACWRYLHVPSYLCVNEYGMTEMLSQFYDDALLSRWDGSLLPRAKIGPHWTRTVVVNPTTLEPIPDGNVGLLRHLDLANWESISAIQTLDLAETCGRGFALKGRAGGAETRGCSQLLETILD
jgi:hypothetical protein